MVRNQIRESLIPLAAPHDAVNLKHPLDLWSCDSRQFVAAVPPTECPAIVMACTRHSILVSIVTAPTLSPDTSQGYTGLHVG